MTSRDSVTPEGAPGLVRFSHDAMACTFEIRVPRDADRMRSAQAAQAVFDEIDRLERELSRFIEHSDVSQMNALRAGQSVRVGIDAFDCLQIAERIRIDSGGAFDVCYASPARTGGTNRAGADGALFALDPHSRSVVAHVDDLRMDLGGIGKGYAVDSAAELLVEWGISTALIHAGQSTVYALGAPPGKVENGWRIALRDPVEWQRVLAHAEIRDAALSGSGRILHGEHIVDPASGAPPTAETGASWAIAASAAVSDALSTTFLVLPPSQALELCRRYPGVCGAQLRTMASSRRIEAFPPGAPIQVADVTGPAAR